MTEKPNSLLRAYIKSITTFVSGEYSPLTKKEKIYFIIATGLFVFLFLLYFQPFGVNNYNPQESITSQFFLFMLIFGSYVSLVLAINEFVIYPLVIRDPVRKKMIAWIAWSIIWLSTWLFFFYNFLGGWHDFKWTSYFQFIANIGTLGIIPIIGAVLYKKIRDLRSSLDSAYSYSHEALEKEHLLVLKADNLKDHFTIPLKHLVYIETEDNYVGIYHLLNGSLIKTLFRKSLKSIQGEQHHAALVRCHRSCLINLIHLQHVTGNRNKLSVHLEHVGHPISVSRQYLEDIYMLISK